MRRLLPIGLVAAAVCIGLTAVGAAHIRLLHPIFGVPLTWSDPEAIDIVIHETGPDDLSDRSHETALRLALAEWNAALGGDAQLIEDTSPVSRARVDWNATDLHTIYFDETNSSGYFAPGSQTVAITPLFFDLKGRILDADILFNGRGFGFTTSGEARHFDIQDVATHELGHVLGLDHSGWAGSSMYPFVDPSVILHRSLSEDERRGLREVYSRRSFGRISGIVRRADGSAVQGAHVVATDTTGRTRASVLSGSAGTFTLTGLDPDTYELYAAPLDGPVDVSNLSDFYTLETDFAPGFFPGTIVISGSEEVAIGTLEVADDVTLNLGTSYDRLPIKIVQGRSQTVSLSGRGLFAPATLTSSDPDLILGLPEWDGSRVTFQVTAAAQEPPGHVDLTVLNALGHRAVLTAALEITPPAPRVLDVQPSLGSRHGGTQLTISGSDFLPGSRIVVGDRIYHDGIAGTAVSGANEIRLVTQSTVEGLHDVVVIGPSGLEGRRSDAVQFAAVPAIRSVFPAAGHAQGGTEVMLEGADLHPGLTVRIAGVEQDAVEFVAVEPGEEPGEETTRVRFLTLPSTGALSGTPVPLEVENPDGSRAQGLFTYSDLSDPVLTAIEPATGTASGGDTILLRGAHFTSDTVVRFGVDSGTGAGGMDASSVTFLDEQTLEVVTPAFGVKGSVCVLVGNDATGQAALLDDGFSFGSSEKSSGGGCYVRPESGRAGARGALAGSWWLAGVWLVLQWRRRPAPAPRPQG